MDSHETDVPVWSRHHPGDDTAEPETAYGSQATYGTTSHEAEDDELRQETGQASHEAGTTDAAHEVPDEDVVVIESHEAGDPGSDAPDAGEASPGIILSAGPDGAAEPAAPGNTAHVTDVSETSELDTATPETAMPETTAPDTTTPDAAAAEAVVLGTTDSAELRSAAAEPVGEPAGTAAAMDATPEADVQRWSEIKAMFVDDPGESVKLASGLVERAIENLMASFRQRQESLVTWESGDAAGTEELRTALRGYRILFEQLDGLSSQFRPGRDPGQTTVIG